MIEDFKIRLGQGIDKIHFGMTRVEVKKIFGKPDEIAEYELSDNTRSETYFYDDLGLDFTFESDEDYLLSYISVSSEEFHLADRLRVGIPKDEVLNIVKDFKWEDPTIEDASTPEFPNHELIEFDNLNLHVWLDDHMVSEIQFGPERPNARSIVWGEFL